MSDSNKSLAVKTQKKFLPLSSSTYTKHKCPSSNPINKNRIKVEWSMPACKDLILKVIGQCWIHPRDFCPKTSKRRGYKQLCGGGRYKPGLLASSWERGRTISRDSQELGGRRELSIIPVSYNWYLSPWMVNLQYSINLNFQEFGISHFLNKAF